MSDEFPAELTSFIAQHIESLAQLEALLMMKQDPSRRWDGGEFARALYISDDMCRGLVADLQRRGFIARDNDGGSFHYSIGDVDRDRLLTQLGELYIERRVAVITQIYSNPMKKVQTFADAFRLRNKD